MMTRMLAVGLCLLAWCSQAVTLAWDANSETNLAGYIVYWGTNSGSYGACTNVHNVTLCRLRLDDEKVYFAAVTAYNSWGIESDFSNEVSWTNHSGVISIPKTPSVIPDQITLTTFCEQWCITAWGQDGQTAMLERSEDLKNWTQCYAIDLSPNGTRLQLTNFGFYRLKL